MVKNEVQILFQTYLAGILGKFVKAGLRVNQQGPLTAIKN